MNPQELTVIQAAKVVDARAMACPGPLLEAKKSIGAVKVGEVLEIWSGDANTKDDMPRWCKKVGHEYLGDLVGDGYDRLFLEGWGRKIQHLLDANGFFLLGFARIF